jgi:type IV pilus biogenesis protein CpaD/CtpE
MEVIYCDELRHSLSAQFKISPVAIVAQAGRCGQIILDLSFPIHVNKLGEGRRGEVIQEAVNLTAK